MSLSWSIWRLYLPLLKAMKQPLLPLISPDFCLLMPVPRAAVDRSRTSTLADPFSYWSPPSRSAVIRHQYYILFWKGQRQMRLLWYPCYRRSGKIIGVDDLRTAERLHWLFLFFPPCKIPKWQAGSWHPWGFSRCSLHCGSVLDVLAQRAVFGMALSQMYPKSCLCFTAWGRGWVVGCSRACMQT